MEMTREISKLINWLKLDRLNTKTLDQGGDKLGLKIAVSLR